MYRREGDQCSKFRRMGSQSQELNAVYGVSRDLPLNYITRREVDDKLLKSLRKGKHLVIFGSSKQGKTSLRKYNLVDSSYVLVTCSNKWGLPELHEAILKRAGYELRSSTTTSATGHVTSTAEFVGRVTTPVASVEGAADDELGIENSTSIVHQTLEIDLADVNEIIRALEASHAPRLIVLEDFHYLPEDTQDDFAVALKAFHEDSNYTFIVVGVWKDENRLIQANGDLSGRVISINADDWSCEKLREVIEYGEELLNIKFDETLKEGILRGCFGSVYVVQEACILACENAGVTETAEEPIVIRGDATVLIREVVNSDSARFTGFIRKMMEGFQESTLEMYRWILLAVITAPLTRLGNGLSFVDIRQFLNRFHPDNPINPGNVTQALKYVVSLQLQKKIKPIILDYDETTRRLHIVDQSFYIWLQNQDRLELIRDTDLGAEIPEEELTQMLNFSN